MDFIVTDREGIESRVSVRSAYIVISISDPGSRRPKVRKQSGLRGVLYLTFNDAEPPTTESMVLFSPDQARQIVEFVARHQSQVGAVVVHCHQGMSRSPAIAAVLCKSFGGDDSEFRENCSPNVHVYQLVRQAAKGKFK